MANNIWAIVLSIIILLIILLILWFLFRKKIGGSSNQGNVKEVEEYKEDTDTKGQKVEEAQYRELNKEEKNTPEKDYKYDKDKVRNKLKELE